MQTRTLPRIADVPATAWDALFPSPYPFTRHAFLAALEAHRCVGRRTGWEPCHLVLEEAGTLVAAMPLYRKQHSYGEFVFDFAWAEAAHRLGARYYPKLTCAIPFTPVAGPRVGATSQEARASLVAALRELVADGDASSAHALFLDDADAPAFGADSWLERNDVQFHWRNPFGDYTFEQFLARLSSDKRKKIKRERRRVSEAGIRFEWRGGDTLSEAEWLEVYALYGNTYEERGQAPYLTREFFLDYGRKAGSPLRLVLAYDAARLIAVAITLVAGDTLYGRHWGCGERYDGLHFETCYYQGIDLCLAEGLTHFDAGAQGAHKLARGFEPVLTRSAHRLADERLARAVAQFLARERHAVAEHRVLLADHSPYRHDAAVSDG